jgi:hypothetical protein
MDVVIEPILERLKCSRGVLMVKVLSEEEKKAILDVESLVEEKIVYGMCKSLNQGVRESLQRRFTVAVIMDTSVFEYPHHPYMTITCGELVVGELIHDKEKIEELKKDHMNLFLWENLVVYMQRVPRSPEERKKMRLVYHSREPLQLSGLPNIRDCVFGTPSAEGDTLIKRMLNNESNETVIGTSLIGFNIEREV